MDSVDDGECDAKYDDAVEESSLRESMSGRKSSERYEQQECLILCLWTILNESIP